MDRFSSKVKDKNVKEFLEFLKNGWNLNDAEQVERETAKPITVWIALSRMWTLIGNEHWLLYVAFIALIVAAVCYRFFVSALIYLHLRILESFVLKLGY